MSNKTNILQIRRNIRKELKDRGKKVQRLCKELGVNRFYIAQLKDDSPISKIITIANKIGCSPSDLLNGL